MIRIQNSLTVILIFLLPVVAFARVERETLFTSQGDKISIAYDIKEDGNKIKLTFDEYPGVEFSSNYSALKKKCDGSLDKLKVVFFERVGDHGKVEWTGDRPKAFLLPDGVTAGKSEDGYYILGEAAPLNLSKSKAGEIEMDIPLYLAVYKKKGKYEIIGSTTTPLVVELGKPVAASTHNTSSNTGNPASTQRAVQQVEVISGDYNSGEYTTEVVEVYSSEESSGENGDITRALSNIRVVREMLDNATEYPMSQALVGEVVNLRALKDRISDPDVLDQINQVISEFDQKESALKEASKQEARQAQEDAEAKAQAMIAEQKAEAEKQKAEEAKLREEADKEAKKKEKESQKRTLWMIIGGVGLAVLGFVGNAVFKHFRDIRNQKSIQQMQDSIVRQAENEANRRSREILRNKAHKVANQGKAKIRETATNAKTGAAPKKKTNSKIKSI